MSSLDHSYDVFLLGHPEDKQFVTGLHQKLTNYGLTVFFPDKSIPWGNLIHSTITRAIQKSRKAILIVSKAVLSDPTTDLEQLIGATFSDSKGKTPVLPVLLDVTEEEFKEKQPLLAVYKSMKAMDMTVETLARNVYERHQSTRDACLRGFLLSFCVGSSEEPKPTYLVKRMTSRLHPRPLPAPLPSFQGRQELLKVLSESLSQSHRVIAVTGLPGVGKNKLVIALGHSLLLNGGDSIPPSMAEAKWVVACADVSSCSEADQCAGVILDALNETPVAGQEYQQLRDLTGQLVESPCSRLLLLSHCDEIIKCHPDQFGKLLNMLSPTFQIVFTSSWWFISLELQIKHIELDPLDLDAATYLILSLCNCKPGNLSVTFEQAQTFARLCGGMPMAINVLASGLRTICSPADLLESLYNSVSEFQFLKHLEKFAEATVSPQSGVTIAIEAVFRELHPPLQDQLICLNFFQGAFSKEDAAFLLEMDKFTLSFDVLMPLTRCSLLPEVAKDRFCFNPLMVRFLRGKCSKTTSALVDKARQRYAELFCPRLQEAALCYNKNAKEGMEAFRADRANYVQFFRFACLSDITDGCIHLAVTAAPLLKAAISSVNRQRIFKLCSVAAQGKDNKQDFIRLQLLTLEALLDDFHKIMENGKEMEELEDSKKRAEEIGDHRLIIECLLMKAHLLMAKDEHSKAFELLMGQVLGPYEKTEIQADPFLAGFCYAALAAAAEEVDGPKPAVSLYEKAYEFLTFSLDEMPYPIHPAVCAVQLQTARCQFDNGDYESSRQNYAKVLEAQRTLLCDRLSQVTTLYHLGVAKVCSALAKSDVDMVLTESAFQDLKQVEEDLERLCNGCLHPLQMWTDLALGKVLFIRGLNTKRRNEAEAKHLFAQAEVYFLNSFLARQAFVLEELDYLELSAECHVYLCMTGILLAKFPGRAEDTSGLNHHKETCRLVDKLKAKKKISPVLMLVAADSFAKKYSSFGAVRMAFSKQGIVIQFTGCFSALQRWRVMEKKRNGSNIGSPLVPKENQSFGSVRLSKQFSVSNRCRTLKLATMKSLVYSGVTKDSPESNWDGISLACFLSQDGFNGHI
eukprot:m.33648 g.33648  ORF g.33648 m.33648 type:complete len:1083 (+) comp31861_c0_seq3:165-3413(+)